MTKNIKSDNITDADTESYLKLFDYLVNKPLKTKRNRYTGDMITNALEITLEDVIAVLERYNKPKRMSLEETEFAAEQLLEDVILPQQNELIAMALDASDDMDEQTDALRDGIDKCLTEYGRL